MAFATVREIIVDANVEFRVPSTDIVISVTPTGINQYKVIFLSYARAG